MIANISVMSSRIEKDYLDDNNGNYDNDDGGEGNKD